MPRSTPCVDDVVRAEIRDVLGDNLIAPPKPEDDVIAFSPLPLVRKAAEDFILAVLNYPTLSSDPIVADITKRRLIIKRLLIYFTIYNHSSVEAIDGLYPLIPDMVPTLKAHVAYRIACQQRAAQDAREQPRDRVQARRRFSTSPYAPLVPIEHRQISEDVASTLLRLVGRLEQPDSQHSYVARPLAYCGQGSCLIAAEQVVCELFYVFARDAPDIFRDHYVRERLIRKLLIYLMQTGRHDPGHVMALLPRMREVAYLLLAHPRLIYDDTSFGRYLRHIRPLGEIVTTDTPEDSPDVADFPPRLTVWTDGTYYINELTHPWHLMCEGRAMNNCLSRTPRIFGFLGNQPNESIFNLGYWHELRTGKRRIFSFGDANRPFVDITYCAERGVLTDILDNRNHRPEGKEPWALPMAEGLAVLSMELGCIPFRHDALRRRMRKLMRERPNASYHPVILPDPALMLSLPDSGSSLRHV